MCSVPATSRPPTSDVLEVPLRHHHRLRQRREGRRQPPRTGGAGRLRRPARPCSAPTLDAVKIPDPDHLHHDHVIGPRSAARTHLGVQQQRPTPLRTPRDGRGGGASWLGAADWVSSQLPAAGAGRDSWPTRPSAADVPRTSAPWSARPIRAVFGQPAPRATARRLDSATRAAISSTTWCTKLPPWPPDLLDLDITTVQAVVATADLFMEPYTVTFEYEAPSCSDHGGASRQLYMRSSYYGADEATWSHRGQGLLWVTGPRRDARPPPVMLSPATGTSASPPSSIDLDADWGPLRAVVTAFHRLAVQLDAGRHVARDAVEVLRLYFTVARPRRPHPGRPAP